MSLAIHALRRSLPSQPALEIAEIVLVLEWCRKRMRSLDPALAGSGPTITLTPAETRVAGLVAQFKTMKEIAKVLNVAPKTVEAHEYNIRRKLGMRHNAQVGEWFRQHVATLGVKVAA